MASKALSPFLRSLLAEIPDLSPEFADVLAREGMTEPRHYSGVSAADIRALGGVSLSVAAEIKTAADKARTAGPAPADVVALRTLLSAVPDPAALDALEARGAVSLPMDGQGVVAVAEALALLSASPGAVSEAVASGVWRGRPLKTLRELRPVAYAPRSPTSGELLQDGVDWRTGVRWADLPPAELGLARWTVVNRMTGGLSDRDLFADFRDGGPISGNARAVSGARGVKPAELAAFACEAPRPAAADAGAAVPCPRGLPALFLSLFAADELRRWLRGLPDGEALTGGLPGATASAAQMAHSATELLERGGHLDDRFWTALENERPRRVADIRAVRRGR